MQPPRPDLDTAAPPAGGLITLDRARRAIAEGLVCPGATAALGPRRFLGHQARKPWDYPVTAAVPHVGPVGALPLALDLWREQTERPYLLLIDSGSRRADAAALEALRADDAEVHLIRSHAYQHSSGPVSAALDLALTLCRTPFLFLTHNDVFPRRRDLLAWLLGQCGPHCPVVGYEQSPRPGDGWRGAVFHTCTLLYVPALRAAGASWSFEHYWHTLGYRPAQQNGYPDTEQPFDLCLRRAGIRPKLLGTEDNYRRFTDANVDHARSWTGLGLYAEGTALEARSRAAYESATAEARVRLAQWKEDSLGR